MADAHHDVAIKRCISPISLGATGSGGKTGVVIDTAGFDGVEFVFSYGAVTATNATVLPIAKEGDVTGAMTSIADANLIGLEANASLGQAATRTSGVSKNVTKRLGYNGGKRYVTSVMPPTVSGGIIAGCDVMLSRARNRPVAT